MKTIAPPTRSLLAVAAAAALFLGACSAGGSDDASDQTTTAARTEKTTTTVEDSTTTTEEDSTTTTTEATDDGDGPSTADLEAILPAAADLGTGWSVDTSDDGPDDESDDDFEKQCPKAAAYDIGDDDDSDSAKVTFTNADNQEVSLSLSPSAKAIAPDDLTGYAAALNECTPSVTDPDNGLVTDFTFDVRETSEYGDQGLQIEATIKLSDGPLPKPLTVVLYSLVYRSGTVGVEINGQDGIDDAGTTAKPFAPDLLIKLADEIDPKILELTGG